MDVGGAQARHAELRPALGLTWLGLLEVANAIVHRFGLLLGHTQIESMVRFLGFEADDAIEFARSLTLNVNAMPLTPDIVGGLWPPPITN